MRALAYHGPQQTSWDTIRDPSIENATDAIVRVDATTVCGSDLHFLRGDLPRGEAGNGPLPGAQGDDDTARPAGGAGVLAADACAEAGLALPPFTPETVDDLLAVLPEGAAADNPVDATAAVTEEQLSTTAAADRRTAHRWVP